MTANHFGATAPLTAAELSHDRDFARALDAAD